MRQADCSARPYRTVVGADFVEHCGVFDRQVVCHEQVVDLAVRSVCWIGATARVPLPTSEGQCGRRSPEIEVAADDGPGGSPQLLGQAVVMT